MQISKYTSLITYLKPNLLLHLTLLLTSVRLIKAAFIKNQGEGRGKKYIYQYN